MTLSTLLSKTTPVVTVLVALALPTTLLAKEYASSGGATYIVTDSESTTDANGTTTVVSTSKTIIVCDDESVPFHMAPQTAVGTNVFDADGNFLTGVGYAHAVDKDGDVMYIWWRATDGGSEWGFISGSGKYAGMKGGGTSESVTFADGSQVVRWHGKWTMKD